MNKLIAWALSAWLIIGLCIAIIFTYSITTTRLQEQPKKECYTQMNGNTSILYRIKCPEGEK